MTASSVGGVKKIQTADNATLDITSPNFTISNGTGFTGVNAGTIIVGVNAGLTASGVLDNTTGTVEK